MLLLLLLLLLLAEGNDTGGQHTGGHRWTQADAPLGCRKHPTISVHRKILWVGAGPVVDLQVQ
jgi:hypothetical protein